MRRMPLSMRALSITLLALGMGQAVFADSHDTLPPNSLESTLNYYLEADCGTEPKDPLARKKPFGPLLTLLKLKEDPLLEVRLIEILQSGLYANYGRLLNAQLTKEWKQLEATLREIGATTSDDIPAQLNEESYRKEQFRIRLQSNKHKAAVALVLLNTPTARKALALAAFHDSALAQTIKRAYGKFGITPVLGSSSAIVSSLRIGSVGNESICC